VQNTLRWNRVSIQISQNRAGGVLTQICGNNFVVLKVAPPLIVTSSRFRQGSAKDMSTVLMPQGSEEEGAAQFLILVPSHEAVQISEHRC
jgi:hypothetical protein